jgi:DNA ligase (NAD+)
LQEELLMRSLKALLAKIDAYENPGEAIQGFKLAEIQTLIDKAAQRYYRTDGQETIMTDECYDALIAALRELEPEDERLTRVGIPYSTDELRNKVEHPIPMGSLDNTDDGILGYDKWYTDLLAKLSVASTVVCASLKVDGGSIRLRYEKGRLVEAATRGNGEVGENITANAANFRGVPTVLAKEIDLDVRGEAILYVADYKAIRSRDMGGVPFDDIPEKERSNPRNIGNGMLGRDDGQDTDKLHFIAFNCENGRNFATEQEKFEYLRGLGFQPVPHRICESVEDVEQFYSQTVDQRDQLPFEIDGVVVCLNSLDQQDRFVTSDPKTRLRPKYARAIKFPHKSNKTVLESVGLTVGHTGAIIPTANLEEVRIGGVNVTHALLNNWDEIGRLGVCIGDTVEVILAGDIIPKIIRVVTPGANRQAIPEPHRCPACGDPATRERRGKKGAVVYCTNDTCPEKMLQKIDHWIGTSKKGVGILGIGDTILRTLWDEQVINDPADLYTMTVDQMKDLEMNGGGRIGESRATEIVRNVAANKHLTLPVFLGSLGIELLGRRRVQILQEAASGELDTLDDWLDDAKLESIKIEGLGDTIRQAIRDGIDENRKLIAKLVSVGVTIDVPVKPEAGDEGPMDGISFCFTGTRECIEQVQELGATIKSSVAKSKPTPDFLVQKDPLSKSNKTKNAEANGHTRIISLEYLKRVLAGEASLDDTVPAGEMPLAAAEPAKVDTDALAAELTE